MTVMTKRRKRTALVCSVKRPLDDAAFGFLLADGEVFAAGKLFAVDPEIAEKDWFLGLYCQGYGVSLTDRKCYFNLCWISAEVDEAGALHAAGG